MTNSNSPVSVRLEPYQKKGLLEKSDIGTQGRSSGISQLIRDLISVFLREPISDHSRWPTRDLNQYVIVTAESEARQWESWLAHRPEDFPEQWIEEIRHTLKTLISLTHPEGEACVHLQEHRVNVLIGRLMKIYHRVTGRFDLGPGPTAYQVMPPVPPDSNPFLPAG